MSFFCQLSLGQLRRCRTHCSLPPSVFFLPTRYLQYRCATVLVRLSRVQTGRENTDFSVKRTLPRGLAVHVGMSKIALNVNRRQRGRPWWRAGGPGGLETAGTSHTYTHTAGVFQAQARNPPSPARRRVVRPSAVCFSHKVVNKLANLCFFFLKHALTH